jgi:hypothetical protein
MGLSVGSSGFLKQERGQKDCVRNGLDGVEAGRIQVCAPAKFYAFPTCLQRAGRVPDHQLLRGQDGALFGAGTLMSLSKAFAQA